MSLRQRGCSESVGATIAVLDYGIGNLRSAEKALQHVGADARLVSDPREAAAADAVVLPGVGAFGSCAAALRGSELDRVALDAVAAGKPMLAVCIGMQLLFEGSDESPGIGGLGVLGGVIRRLPDGVKRPQMQWNLVTPRPGSADRLVELTEPDWFYFVHGYSAVPEDPSVVAGTCEYGTEVVAAVGQGNLFATQFHPEKSGKSGLALLRRFSEQVQRAGGGVIGPATPAERPDAPTRDGG